MTNYNVKYNSNQIDFNSSGANSSTNFYNNANAPSPAWNGNKPPQPEWNGNKPPQLEWNGNQPPPPPYQASPQAHLSNPQMDRNLNEQKFREIILKYEISHLFSQKLQLLFSFKIVFIFDDSGSMNSVLNDSPLNTGLFKATRWDELQQFAKISIDIANVFNTEGVDVHFLNRPAARNVKNMNDLVPYFVNKPAGYTPLNRVLRNVLNQSGNVAENKLLILIVTDGEPTDDRGQADINGFKQCLMQRNAITYTTIVSCTDEDNTMEYLNNWDRTIPRLDVVDDFRNEKVEILRAKGQNFRFSFGDYVVKSLIGSIDTEMDNLDERRDIQENGCCTLL